MIKKLSYFLIFTSLVTLFSCENELDLTAEYEETIVVYSLLDHTQDTQFVKINKTFLGDGNALDYAQEPDSFIYENVYASLTNTKDQSEIVLQPYSAPKEPGIFSDEKNIVYITDQELKAGAKYQLDVVNNNSGESAKATTVVIDTVPLTGYLAFQNSQVNLYSPSGYIPVYVSYAVKPNVFRYESTLVFHYLEYPKSNPSNSTPKQIVFDMGTKLATDATDGSVTFIFEGEEFYQRVAQEVQPDPNLEREVVGMEFLIRAASKELQLYMDASGELDGISQVRPEYSNIENGYGLFASKYENSVHKVFSIQSAQELKEGDYTSRLGFVDNF